MKHLIASIAVGFLFKLLSKPANRNEALFDDKGLSNGWELFGDFVFVGDHYYRAGSCFVNSIDAIPVILPKSFELIRVWGKCHLVERIIKGKYCLEVQDFERAFMPISYDLAELNFALNNIHQERILTNGASFKKYKKAS